MGYVNMVSWLFCSCTIFQPGGSCIGVSTVAYGILHYQGAPKEIPSSKNDENLAIPDTAFNKCDLTIPKNNVVLTELNYTGKQSGPIAQIGNIDQMGDIMPNSQHEF